MTCTTTTTTTTTIMTAIRLQLFLIALCDAEVHIVEQYTA